jgi:hypothetical protein
MSDEDIPKFDISKYTDAMDREQLIELWSKVEVARMLIEQSNKLTRQVYEDIEFFKMATEFKNQNNEDS